MGFRHKIALAAMCGAVAVSAAAAPREPVVVQRLADPDPHFVPPPPDGVDKPPRQSTDQDRIDQAMEEFGRVIGQAAVLEQHQIDARCRAGEPANVNAEQRFDWVAACRYSRH